MYLMYKSVDALKIDARNMRNIFLKTYLCMYIYRDIHGWSSPARMHTQPAAYAPLMVGTGTPTAEPH